MKNYPPIIHIMVLVVISFAFGAITSVALRSFSSPPPQAVAASVESAATDLSKWLPSQKDIQRELERRGYDIGPKGVDGEIGTDSRAAWNAAINDQYAAITFQKVRTE